MGKNNREGVLVGQRYRLVASTRNVVADSAYATAVVHSHIVTVALWRTTARSSALHLSAAGMGTCH
jgi:hypothetical protein